MNSSTIDQSPMSMMDMPTPNRCPRMLYVASTRHSGGLEVASVRQAAMLMRTQPHSQEIIFACKPNCFIEQCCADIGLPTRELVLANSADISSVRTLTQIITEECIDIVHVHSRRDFVAATLAVEKLRSKGIRPDVKLVFQLHLVRSLGSPSLISGYFFGRTVDKFIAVSNTVKSYLLRTHRQLSDEQIVVVPNGIEFDKYNRDPVAGSEIRTNYGIPESALVIGMVGRLDTKGQLYAIKALGKLRRKDIYLILVGASGLKRYLDLLKSVARRHGVEDRVKFCGAQQDTAPFLSAMDIFLHLPIDEAFGLAPAEAMSAGLPVVVSNRGGCLELVENRTDGILVDPKNLNEITAALDDLIDRPELRLNLSMAATGSVRSRFSISVQASALTGIYSQLLQPTPQS